jgi:hypothetical protein
VVLVTPSTGQIALICVVAAAFVLAGRLVLAARLGHDPGRIPLGRNVVPVLTVGSLATVLAMIAGVGVFSVVALRHDTWVAAPSTCVESALSLDSPLQRVGQPRYQPVVLPEMHTIDDVRATYGVHRLLVLPGGHPREVSVKQDIATGGVTVTAREGTYLSLDKLRAKARAAVERARLVVGTGSERTGDELDRFSYSANVPEEFLSQDFEAVNCRNTRVNEMRLEVRLGKEVVGDCAPRNRHSACGVLYGAAGSYEGASLSQVTQILRQRVRADTEDHLVLDYPQQQVRVPATFLASRFSSDLGAAGWNVTSPGSTDVRATWERGKLRCRLRAHITERSGLTYATFHVETVGPL